MFSWIKSGIFHAEFDKAILFTLFILKVILTTIIIY
jgi:hypothetical protein